MSHSSLGTMAMPIFATMLKTATTAMSPVAPNRMERRRPSRRRKRSAMPTALASTRIGMKSPRYLGAMYPHKSKAAAAPPAANRRRRVRATLPSALGRNAVTRPQILRRKRRGMDAGTLEVRYSLSKSTPPTAVGGLVGSVTYGNTLLKLRLSGPEVGEEVCRYEGRTNLRVVVGGQELLSVAVDLGPDLLGDRDVEGDAEFRVIDGAPDDKRDQARQEDGDPPSPVLTPTESEEEPHRNEAGGENTGPASRRAVEARAQDEDSAGDDTTP